VRFLTEPEVTEEDRNMKHPISLRDVVEKTAIAMAGTSRETWATRFREEQRDFWRRRAEAVVYEVASAYAAALPPSPFFPSSDVEIPD
jgi:hypothetical protein